MENTVDDDMSLIRDIVRVYNITTQGEKHDRFPDSPNHNVARAKTNKPLK